MLPGLSKTREQVTVCLKIHLMHSSMELTPTDHFCFLNNNSECESLIMHVTSKTLQTFSDNLSACVFSTAGSKLQVAHTTVKYYNIRRKRFWGLVIWIGGGGRSLLPLWALFHGICWSFQHVWKSHVHPRAFYIAV